MKGYTRKSAGDSARRTGISLSRATIEKSDDEKKLQELDLSLFYGEKKVAVERAQEYGFSSRPLPPKDKQKAEAWVIFPTGTRSHGVAIAVDDRRHRPKKMEEGEVVVYDDQGQKIHIGRKGIRVSGGSSKLPVTVEVGGSTVTISDGTITIKATTIVLDGDVKLGGADASRALALKDSVDSDGDTMLSNLATKVKAK